MKSMSSITVREMLRLLGSAAAAATIGAVVSFSAVNTAAADFTASLLKPGTIVVGTTGSAPPMTMIGPDGQLAGYDIDVMNQVGKDLGLKVEFVQLDWTGLLPGLAARRFDVVASGVTRTKERLSSPDFVIVSPYIIDGVSITKLASNTSIKGWADVCGKHMGTIRGSAESQLVMTVVPSGCITNVTQYPGWTEMALDLKNGRIDWIGQNYLGPAYAAKQDSSLVVIPDVKSPTTMGVAVAGSEADLAKQIDALMVKYRGDGTLDALTKKWYGQTMDWSKMPAD